MLTEPAQVLRTMELVDAPIPNGLEEALTDVVFSQWNPEFLKTDQGRYARQEVLVNRYRAALRFAVPWLSRAIDLPASRIVEVGCGSGSSTAAIAHHGREVVGLDIDGRSIRAAEARCEAYGLRNVRFIGVEPARLLDTVRELGQADVYLLYAVLEHLTWQERIDTLSTLWGLLQPGKHLAVIETPNRLAYEDRHTAFLPFFHMLPDELAFRYLDRVHRADFRSDLETTLKSRPEEAGLKRIRWGLGASYHEFEIALNERLEELVVADGLEQEMIDFFPVDLDEEVLVRYFREKVPEEPVGFGRATLNVILRKPIDESDRERARRYNAARRAPPPAASAPRGPWWRRARKVVKTWLRRSRNAARK